MPPVSEDLLIYFVAHCHEHLHIKYNTIKVYLCGIRFHYLQAGVSNPFCSGACNSLVRLQTMLKGVKRHSTTVTRPRYPITFPILCKMCDRLAAGFFSPNTNLMLLAACSAAFFGFLRCGELTVTNTFDSAVNICVGDVTFYADFVLLHLKTSKTDPFRHGVDIKLFQNNHRVCPFQLLQRYVSVRRNQQAMPTDPLFVTDAGQPLNRQYFIQCTRDVLLAVGLQPDMYNGHSYRIGASTSCAQMRIEDHLIKTMGRWSSDSYLRYIRTPVSALSSAQRSLTLS
jgi:hypothetical protein